MNIRVEHHLSDPVRSTGAALMHRPSTMAAVALRLKHWSALLIGGLAVLFIVSGCGDQGLRSGVFSQTVTGVFTNSLGMKFLPLPAGQIGLLAVWETRVQDFAAFVDDSGHDASKNFYYYQQYRWNTDTNDWRHPGFEQTPEHPVVGVSWGDAMAFCHWLTERERALGLIDEDQWYRLPSSREWNLASTPGLHWPIPTNTANYSPQLEVDDYYHTAPVGSFPPNANGFHDMEGNVWEFCIDREKDEANYVVIRGGSWQNWHPRFVGQHARGSCGSHVRIALYGFRVILISQDRSTANHLNRSEKHEGT